MTETLAFGPFRLLVARRELLAHGVPVTLGQRAFEILLMLVSRHGQLVTKDELMAEVWPGVVVEENNIQVHISAVRKVLATAGDGERYLLTVAGRGYRFVAPVKRECAAELKAPPAPGPDQSAAVPAGFAAPTNNLPQQLTSLIGREADLADIEARLSSHRLVTLTGSGGVGKTRLAIEAGRSLLARYPDGVWLAELAPLNDSQLVTSIIGEVLGVSLSAPSRCDRDAGIGTQEQGTLADRRQLRARHRRSRTRRRSAHARLPAAVDPGIEPRAAGDRGRKRCSRPVIAGAGSERHIDGGARGRIRRGAALRRARERAWL